MNFTAHIIDHYTTLARVFVKITIIFITGGPLRFPNSLLLWLTAEQDVLDKRISDRVDEMINKGLVKEIKSFYENHVRDSSDDTDAICSENVDVTKSDLANTEDLAESDVKQSSNVITFGVDCTSNVGNLSEIDIAESENNVMKSDGVSQSESKCERKRANSTTRQATSDDVTTTTIGTAYNDKSHHNGPSSKRRKVTCDENSLLKSYEEGIFQAIGFKEFHTFLTYSGQCDKTRDELLQKSMTTLKQIMTRYSKKQVRWVLNRIVNRTSGNNSLPVYNLDATDVEAWDLNVLEKAKSIVESFVKGDVIQEKPFESLTSIISNKMEDITGHEDGQKDTRIGL